MITGRRDHLLACRSLSRFFSGLAESEVKRAEKRDFGFTDRTCAPELRSHHIKFEESGLKEGPARCEVDKLGEVVGVFLEDLDEIGERRVVHDLLILPLIPVDGLFPLFGSHQPFEYLCREALPVPLVAIYALQHLANGDTHLAEDLGYDAIGIDVLF